MGVFSGFSTFGFYADYLTDRVVRVYSTWIFIILSVVVAIALSGNGAITCWVPGQFTTSHYLYTETACLNGEGSLSLPYDDFIPIRHELSDLPAPVNTAKFQKFPIMLFFQAFLFLLPWLLWRLVSGGACNLDAVVREATRIPTGNQTEVRYSVCGHLRKLLCNPCAILGGAGGGYVLSLAYLLVKFLYWTICFVQMAAIAAYFDIRFFSFMIGRKLWETYSQLEVDGNSTQVNVPFPKQVICDFSIRRLGNLQRYTVQCGLGISDTMESCLGFLWFWMVFVLVILSLSGAAQFIHTILRFVRPMAYCKRFLKQRLAGVDSFNMASSDVIQKFCRLYLKPDMFFVIGIIEENGSISAATLGLKELWEDFLNAGKVHVEPAGMLPAEEVMASGPGGGMQGGQAESARRVGPYKPLQDELKQAEVNL